MKIVLDDNILTKFIAEECSPEEKSEILRLLKNSPGARERLSDLEKVWKATGKKLIYQDPEEAWSKFLLKADISNNVNKKISFTVKSYFSSNIIRYAAAIMILILPLYYILTIPDNPESVIHNLKVGFGERKKVTLSDGTIVTLDSGSEIFYPEEFGKTREVSLNGEAYFEVNKDSVRPFIVEANQGKVEVLGTKFNIRSWKKTKRVHLAVSEGKVSFMNNLNHTDTVFITAGKYSVIDSVFSPTEPAPISPGRISGWINNEKYFEETTLSEVINQLERWYNIDIELNDKSALNQVLSVHLKDNGYKAGLNLIALITGLKVEYRGSKIILN